MEWEIDRFSVKINSVFIGNFFAAVIVNENGEVRTTGLPGYFNMPNNNISSYPSNDRRYQISQLITEYCNNDTHSFYRVYAQDEHPYARVETDVNQAKCGYLEPLPEPAVPSNPFGTPNYGLYRTFSYCDDKKQLVEVDIEAKNYDGEVFPIEVGGKSPVILSYKEVDDKFAPIRPLECKLSFVVDENFLLEQFYTSDERAFIVTVRKGGIVKFKGYIIPDSCAEPFDAPPYEVTIRATDAIGGLKSVTYPIPEGGNQDKSQSFVEILAYCFSMTNLNLNIATICNLYAETMPNSLNHDPLSLTNINPIRLSNDNGTTLSAYDVLEAVATAWGGFIAQVDGVWNLVRVNELSNNIIRRRNYNNTGLFLYSENISTNRVVGAIR